VTTSIVIIFLIVYIGMILGGLPFVQLDRTGVALLGAIAMISVDAVSLQEAAESVHLPTIILLFSFMVLSAQMRLGGFYDWVTRSLGARALSPPRLLGAMMIVVAGLSAVFSNDIVCLAVAPVLINACIKRRLDPIPYLLALACAANIGSAATLIGNPQNMLIGQTLRLSFAGYFAEALLPVVLGLVTTWGLIVWQTRSRWALRDADAGEQRAREQRDVETVLDRWQTAKGLAVAAVLLVVFLFAPWPREHVALTAAGVLLMSRRLHSNKMLGLVDWELLVLFMGLFVVNHALQRTGVITTAVDDLTALGLDLRQPGPLFVATFVLSNVVSNVPAVMLLLPLVQHPLAGPLLALVSTLAGNLLIVGSIANIIVVDAAARRGVRIDWRRHAYVGVPVTVATLAILVVYLWVRLRVVG
jgi:Na+/H+ antiporter NhaD/arsenite permease-like protein